MSRSADARAALDAVLARVEAAARRAGRDPSEVMLIGVTKTVPSDRILGAVDAGLAHLGENRVQEAETKASDLASISGRVTWHLVGHLQANKARRAAELFQFIHSVDSAALASRLSRFAAEAGRRPQVLLQVDLAGEATKFGADPEALTDLAAEVASLPGISLRGLMTLPPMFDDPESSRPFFRKLREIRDDLAARELDLPHLSMGMSADFEVAIEEGATMVRVGRALFGERARP